ncbi:MAG: 50S ribosomal protein L28 [Dehalococcoidia bacterium]|nr:50S ribosomal protein L28 [Dehalococcoidia bacterium]
MRCELCGKGTQFGHSVSHSKRHTKREWAPNLRTKTVESNGRKKRMTICTRCLRTQHKVTG